jgi:transcriptional regulator with XRE-family HTH domain
MFDFSLIQRAGLSQGQFAELVGTARVTVNLWVRGKYSPRKPMDRRVKRALDLLQKAIDEGTLPVQKVDHRAQMKARLDTISKALSKEA